MSESLLKIIKNLGDELQGLLIGVGLLIWVLFIHLNSNRVYALSDLRSLEVILLEKPRYNTSWVKGTTYRSVSFQAYGYSKDFEITNFTFKSTDHQRLKMELDENDTVSVWMTENEIKALRKSELVNNYNEIFGLVYKDYNYIDFDDRNEYQSFQNKWAKIILGLLGMIFITQNIRKVKINLPTSKLNKRG